MINKILNLNGVSNSSKSKFIVNKKWFGALSTSSKEKCPRHKNDGITWENAMPFDKIPGGSAFDFLKFLFELRKGGKYHNLSLMQIHKEIRKNHGDISKAFSLSKLLTGKNNLISIFDPDDIEYVFRTEGKFPSRKNVDSIKYFRENVRQDVFKGIAGVALDLDEKWYDFRTKVNPILMQPKIVKQYIPWIDEISIDFIQRISNILDENNETPANFIDEITKFSLESICWIAMEKRLGALKDDFHKNTEAQEFIKNVHEMFDLIYHLDFKPSLWRIYPTRNFKRMLEVCDKITNSTMKYIDEAIERINTKSEERTDKKEVGVLENLYKIDRHIAIIMALDMLGAGVDTTSGMIASTIYILAKNPEKQEILRKEIMKIMPTKDTKLTKDLMKNLPYLRACIKESMRISPVVTGNLRSAGKDIVLKGYKIPKGTDIAMGFAVIQNDEKYFKRSKEFIPERWLRSYEMSDLSVKNTHPFVYLPFGFGPRACVGKRIAEMEIEIIISRLIRSYKIEWHYENVRYSNRLFNFPCSDLKFRLIPID